MSRMRCRAWSWNVAALPADDRPPGTVGIDHRRTRRRSSMSDWTDRLADTLGVARIEHGQEGPLLRASRDIAHRVERKDTPLTTYLIGLAVGSAIGRGTAVGVALDDALATVLGALPPESIP